MRIPEYRLFIHPKNSSKLQKDIWIDESVPAKLTINNKKYYVAIAYRGSHIRDFAKKSFELSFYKPNLYQNAHTVHLNAEFNDPSFIRTKLSFDFFNEIGCLSPQARFISMKVNGKNEGLYVELESVDKYFLAQRQLPMGPIFYAVDGDANFSLMSDLNKEVKKSLLLGYEQKVGTVDDEIHLHEMLIKINTWSREEFESEIGHYVNVEKYLCWLAGVVCTQNFDGFVHNYALYKNGESGLFEIIPWDYDATWGRDLNGEVMDSDYLRITGFNTLTARILDIETFMKRYIKKLQNVLTNHFTVDYLQPKIEEMHAFIRPFILTDPYKKDSIDLFDKEPAYIVNFIKARAAFIKRNIETFI